jgi:hypothetical protein
MVGIVLAIALFFNSVGTLFAGTTGTISGTVTDSKSGAPVVGATVAAVSASATLQTKTDGAGFFSLTGVSPDTYTLSFTYPGTQPTSITGVNVFADQVADVSTKLEKSLTTIGRVTARSQGGAYQPTQTQDTYTVTSAQIQTTLGRTDALSESNLLVSLPGASYDSSGYPVLRGGRENEEGFQFEGIDYTDAFTSQFINSLALTPGVGSLQLTPGSGDASVGNAGTGAINLIAKRGSYPGFGSIQGTLQAPDFNHELGVELGVATPNGRLSSYTAFQGQRASGSTYGRNADARQIGRFFTVTDTIYNDLLENLIFKFGKNNNQSLQFFAEVGQSNFVNSYGGYKSLTYKSADPYFLDNATGFTGFTNAQVQSLLPLDPYQPSLNSKLTRSPGAYYQPNNTLKLQYSNNLDASTFLTLKAYRTDAVVTFDFPYDGDALFYSDYYLKQGGQRSGTALDVTKQLGSKNLVQLGGKYEFLHPVYDFFNTNDGFFSTVFTGQVYDFVPNDVSCPLGVDGGCGYLASQGLTNPGKIPQNNEYSSTNRQDYAFYLTDTFSPSSKTKISAGLRFDGAKYRFRTTDSQYYAPSKIDAATGFPLDSSGKVVMSDAMPYAINVPNEKLNPLVFEPRFAISQQLGPADSVRASFGRSVEFPSLGVVDLGVGRGAYSRFGGIAPNLAICGVTGNLTCRDYADELYWANQNNFEGVPYQPVLPATFTNYDFSYSHEFKNNVGVKVTPFYRRGYNVTALVSNPRVNSAGQPLLKADGTVIFGPPSATNLGINRTTGVEFLLTKEAPVGLSGSISATYINEISNVIPGSASEDFFPTIPSQSLALGNQYRAGFLSPFQATAALQYKTKGGVRINPQIYYVRGYPIGEGNLTAAYVNGVPANVLNTNVTNSNGSSSAFNYVDTSNPGSVLKPNIAATRGTPDGNAAGALLSRAAVFTNLTLEFNKPGSRSTVGVQIFNLFGNVYNGFGNGNNTIVNTRYQPIATGVSGPLSGYSTVAAQYPSLGLAAYNTSAVNGQSPYRIRPRSEGTQYQFYYNLKL